MNTGKQEKSGSLTRELAAIIVGLVAVIIVICWFLNTTFLGKYYMYQKEDTLLEGFHVIDQASETGELTSDKFDVTFDNLCANGNISIMVISSNRNIVRSSVNDNQVILMEFMNVLFGSDQSESEVLKKAENYVIQRKTDNRLDSEYLVLYGTLQNGNLILMRTALESIRESAKISNQFLVYVGLLGIILGAIAAVLISRGISTPILELTDISKRMTELDFEAKFSPRRKHQNEIDELGEHFNRLSNALETTISELKSANNELKQDIQKKTEIDEMRKDFLSNVSHELKTPLALIQGYAEGLKECINDDAESREFYCEVIMDEADKMNQMVKKLLTLNQLEFGNEIVKMERFDVTELINGVVNSSGILLSQNEIQVEFDGTEPLYVWADEFKLEEVITNYLTNAIHHVGGGEKKIQIRIDHRRDGKEVCVEVFNTGNPIPDEALPNLWTKFYKVDKARTREYGGSGIGLSIVKAIMEMHHKACGVKNHENGVEFWFTLDTAGEK